MKTLSIDVETLSSVSLADCGVAKYVESPDFRVLLFAYSIDYGPVEVIDLATGGSIPPDIEEMIFNPEIEKTAYNAAFERAALGRHFHRYCEPEQWSCTMVLASTCGLPLSLAACGDALGLGSDKAKMKEGSTLIRKFCVPDKNGNIKTPVKYPEDWKVFIEYNRRDVEVENTIRQRLLKFRQSYREHKLWCIDQRINDKGIRVDKQLAENAIEIGTDYKGKLMKLATEISGLNNPNSAIQVKQWLQDQEDVDVPSLNKKEVADIVSKLTREDTVAFMSLRAEFSKSSTSKYNAILRSVTEDGHIHGCFQFAGAGRTGRWAGRLVQLQNLPQNHMEDLDMARDLVKSGDIDFFETIYPNVQQVLSELIRTTLIPEDGHRFIVADFSAIEARVLAWLAGEQWRLDTFAEGGDIYCASASKAFKVPVVKHGINGHLRQKGKILELACGYGGGKNAMLAFGADKLGMTEQDMVENVDAWRQASPHIVYMWTAVQEAAISAIYNKGREYSSPCGKVSYIVDDGILWCRLPSGRSIAYYGPGITKNQWGRWEMTYMGQGTNKKWQRLMTWGGKLTENICQAVARDVLKESMLRMSDAGWDIRGHVHDELIITEPIGGRSVDEACEMMGASVDWAEGLPLRADGYECTSYRKD